MTREQWDAALANLEASNWPEKIKAYYRRVWTFQRDGRKYSRADFRR